MSKILVVDDEQMIRLAFAEFLKDEGHSALLAEDGESALEQVRVHKPEIIFLDYRLSTRDGLELLAEIRNLLPTAAVIFMTAFGTMDVTIRAMQLGAYEYLTKPFDLAKVRDIIHRILTGRNTIASLGQGQSLPAVSLDQMVGRSASMQEIYKMIGLLTTQDVTVLVTGESGVGKELVARAIHDNSPRRLEPFVAVNCGAVPENLLESEMFGYEQGAFTGAGARKMGKFEAAGHGSIFLDEIGELQPSLQVKLLRVLQEKSFERVGGNSPVPVQARIIAATNKELHAEMLAGRFRKDLFYRLYLVHINIPALRERREDIPLLVDHFISRFNREQSRKVCGVAASVMQAFQGYSWPGNVRELENQIKRAMVLSRDDILIDEYFEFSSQTQPSGQISASSLVDASRQLFASLLKADANPPLLMEYMVGIVEKTIIDEALRVCNGNQVHAAQMLGIHRSTLRQKMKNHGL
ncbi:MAG: sigma-54 dependent transcriptional regulator [Proteobacteria bacterium]|nr:sigma-54 dependent transcriptional regulator [Pseudomonadota bacterium]MBU4297387.1 sigma-54 dependent transcriptional regulator [Pseudomonadota bacterium]MCG2748731.1 sigma-54 dependent transcriptional regulator [Desulfobulbaceae bacterium]